MRPIWLSLIIAGGVAFLGLFPLLGLPGGLIYAKWSALFGKKLFPELTGDRAWPTAILIAIAWPWFLPLTVWIGRFEAWTPAWPWIAGAYAAWTLPVCFVAARSVR